MSQEKVDKYKEEKKNRKKNLAKEKRKKLFWKIFGPILAILICAGIGCIIYFVPKLTAQQNQEVQGDEIDYDELMKLIEQYSDESPDATSETTDTTTETTDALQAPEAE